MGAWGPGIFSDDLALDVRDEWRAAILDGAAPEQAGRALIDRYADDPAVLIYETVFWVALAAAQMETGRLQDDVRDRALAIIDDGGDLDVWEESGNRGGRERVLRRLAVRLRGPQPAPKRLRRPRPAAPPDPEWERHVQELKEYAMQLWPEIRDSPAHREYQARLGEDRPPGQRRGT